MNTRERQSRHQPSFSAFHSRLNTIGAGFATAALGAWSIPSTSSQPNFFVVRSHGPSPNPLFAIVRFASENSGMRCSDEDPAPVCTVEPWDGPCVMMCGSIASGDGATFSILSQSIPVLSDSEGEEDLEEDEEEEEEEGEEEGPARGCAALPGIEGILYFGVPRIGVGPRWSFKGLGGARRRSRFKGMMFVQTVKASGDGVQCLDEVDDKLRFDLEEEIMLRASSGEGKES